MKYIFSPLKSAEFLKKNVLEFSKTNTVFIGMNCGFGAGYLRLTNSWIDDLGIFIKNKASAINGIGPLLVL
jgi:hypothetical protein